MTSHGKPTSPKNLWKSFLAVDHCLLEMSALFHLLLLGVILCNIMLMHFVLDWFTYPDQISRYVARNPGRFLLRTPDDLARMLQHCSHLLYWYNGTPLP